ncbi:MAG: bifunctional anthranilate synthase component I family protein/class IV aminotransferase [Magnetococcales bacterium]|nr:bifunctional anthranilate synthase component I family protein/class IV aminotransferase [Magnetococcales bacterium]
MAALLRLAEAEARRGHWVGGFLTFESAAAFGLPVHGETTLPLLWLAVFSQVEAVVFPALAPPPLPLLVPEISWARYQQDIQTILSYIAAGESYQVNYTLAAHLASVVDPATLFLALQTRHRHPYAAWLQCEAVTVASFSPELFLQRQGDRLWTGPIKGTCARLADPAADAELGEALLHSPKERAEHVMIVDMARNDLGKVCQTGTVRVEHLFERRLFATIQHMETRVQGRLLPGLTLDRLMAALFPAASITGAPKHRTMEIIRELEGGPRGIYTGSMILLRPGGDFISNVAIRTLSWQGEEVGRMGLGGGIVADSESRREWAEIADKGRFLREFPPPLQLIETFLLDGTGEMPRLQRHLCRLRASARSLGFACAEAEVEKAIRQQAALWHRESREPMVVRLLLEMSGAFTLQKRPCSAIPRGLTVRISPDRVDRLDPLLCHKSSRRQLFDRGLVLAKEAGDGEALFFNALGHVTEGAIRAIAVRLAGLWYVPPLADGLLASIWRQEMQETLQAREKSLTLAELCRADAIRMGNSVQGGVTVVALRDAQGRVLAEWGEGGTDGA